MEPIIEVKDLSKVFKSEGILVEALQKINLKIHKGEIYGIIVRWYDA